MNSKKKLVGLMLAGLVLLPGCIKVPTYHSKSLSTISEHVDYQEIQRGVTLRVKRLKELEKTYLFDEHMQNTADVEIVFFSISNLSANNYSIQPVDISLNSLTHWRVRALIKNTNAITRLAGASIAAPGVWWYSVGIEAVLDSMGSGMGVVIFLYPPLVIAATVLTGFGLTFLATGIKSIVMNARITKDIRNKLFYKEVSIPSGGYHEGLIFVKKADYKSDFSVTLYDSFNKNNKIVFNVTCE